MEMYLRIEDGGSQHLADVEVRVEPSHTVDDLALAVARFLGWPSEPGRSEPGSSVPGSSVPGSSVPGLTVSRRGAGPMAGHLSVAAVGILSGDTMVLARTPGPAPTRTRVRPRTRPGTLMLAVASGPDAGRTVGLDSDAVVVGRDPGCDLPLTDPQVSRRHLRFTVESRDRVTVEVLARDRNEVRTDGHRVLAAEPIGVDQPVRVGATSLVVRCRPPRRRPGTDSFGQVPFHRTPYFPRPVQPVTIAAIDDVPARPEKSRAAYLSALLPLLMGISLAVLFDNPRYLLFAVFSPVMVIGNHFEQRRRSGRRFFESVARFEAELETRTAEVQAALADERLRRFGATPDVPRLRDQALGRSAELWVRDRLAADFLNLRVGMGDVPAAVEVRHPNNGDVDYRDRVARAYGPTDTITDVPVDLAVTELGVVGLIGRAAETSALASSMAVQAATLHSPEELVVLGALAPARAMLDWLKWLPHTRSAGSPVSGRHLVDTRAGADRLVSQLINEAARRFAVGRESARFPWLFVFLDRALDPDAALVSRLLDSCPDAGISVVWLSDSVERVPRQARAVVNCRSPLTARPSSISYTDPDRPDQLLDIDRVSPGLAAEVGLALAPLRDASSANAASAIPRTVPLFTALGIEAVDGDWVAEQWKTDRGHSLQGPIGYTDSGPLILDIVDHGPHGLIGGTSGAGKSELVMSMVAGLIAHNPPTKVNFLFIDYKGGASSDLFADVPHTVGYVTNLDGLLAKRALTSLRAELNRRMSLLQGRAKDLAEMIEKHPAEAPPSLVIVVDEFATLVKEIPDFVSGMVDVAQRGRSLGIHLMLATQRPSGSVNDNIKANTNLRISLRMLDGAESNSVIGTADAATIPAPLKGRGYIRMGAGEPVAFQSAWAGAPLLAASGPPPVGVVPFGHLPVAVELPAGSVGSAVAPVEVGRARTQVDALLAAVVDAAQRLGHGRGRPPWLDVLPPVIPIEEIRASATATVVETAGETTGGRRRPGARIVFGMVDDPESQTQYPAVVDLARSGGLIVTGTGGSGKSTLLETLAVSAALDDAEQGGGHLTIFALDFASRQLGGLERLPQCGGVASGDDLEAVTRIIGLLHGEFERRRQVLADSVARSQAPPEQPVVLLLIDGLDGLVQIMEQGPTAAGLAPYHAELMRIVADGRQVGIHPVVSTTRRGVVRSMMSAAISDRLTLRQADPQGYAESGIGAIDANGLELGPGQAFFNGPTLVQIAMLTDPSPTGTDPVDEHNRRDRKRLADLGETLIGHVDPRLITAPLPQSIGLLAPTGSEPDPLRPVIGLTDFTASPCVLDLTHNNVSIIGDPRSGRSTALATIGRQAAAAGAEVWVLAPPSSPLTALTESTRSCYGASETLRRFVEESVALAAQPADRPRLLLLDDHDLLPENDHDLTAALERLLGSVRYAASGTKPRGFSSSVIVQQVRASRSLIYLRPHDPMEAHEVLGVPVPWHPGLAMVEGRGYVVADRVPVMVQLSDAFID